MAVRMGTGSKGRIRGRMRVWTVVVGRGSRLRVRRSGRGSCAGCWAARDDRGLVSLLVFFTRARTPCSVAASSQSATIPSQVYHSYYIKQCIVPTPLTNPTVPFTVSSPRLDPWSQTDLPILVETDPTSLPCSSSVPSYSCSENQCVCSASHLEAVDYASPFLPRCLPSSLSLLLVSRCVRPCWIGMCVVINGRCSNVPIRVSWLPDSGLSSDFPQFSWAVAKL